MVCLKRWTVTRLCFKEEHRLEAVMRCLVQQVLHAVDAEASASGVWEQHVTALRLAQPGFQHGECRSCNGCTTFLAALANYPHVAAGSENNVLAFEPSHLG